MAMASSSPQQSPLCALPPLPNVLPKLPHIKELDGFLSSLSNLHSLLSNALNQCKHSLDCSFHEALHKNPLLLRLLPPQILPPQVRDYRKRRNQLAAYNFAAILPGDSIATVVVSNGIMNFLNIYNTLLIVRLILTWFPDPPAIIVNPLSSICDPYLSIFRGIIPPLGGTLDLSPILAFLVLNVFTNSAAALPAELPVVPTAVSESSSVRSSSIAATLTRTQKTWLKRQALSMENRRDSN